MEQPKPPCRISAARGFYVFYGFVIFLYIYISNKSVTHMAAPTEVDVYTELSDTLGDKQSRMLIEFIVNHRDKQLEHLATKGDLAVLRTDLEKLRTEISDGFSVQLRWLLGFLTVVIGLLAAVVLKN